MSEGVLAASDQIFGEYCCISISVFPISIKASCHNLLTRPTASSFQASCGVATYRDRYYVVHTHRSSYSPIQLLLRYIQVGKVGTIGTVVQLVQIVAQLVAGVMLINQNAQTTINFNQLRIMEIKFSDSPLRQRFPLTLSPMSRSQIDANFNTQRLKTDVSGRAPTRGHYINELSAKIQVMQQKIKDRSDYVSPTYMRSSQKMTTKTNLMSSSKFTHTPAETTFNEQQLRSSFQDGITINIPPIIEKEAPKPKQPRSPKPGFAQLLETNKLLPRQPEGRTREWRPKQKQVADSQNIEIPRIEGLSRENSINKKSIFLSTNFDREQLQEFHKLSRSRTKEVVGVKMSNKSAIEGKGGNNLEPVVQNDKITKSINKSLSVIQMVKSLEMQKKPRKHKNSVEKQYCKDFDIGVILGKGKFGEVFLARHSPTGCIVALKKIPKAKLIEYNIVEQFIKEIKLHNSMNHPNIVKFYGVLEERESFYLVLEYMNGGTLFDYLNVVGTLKIRETVEFLKDVIEAITYMHQRSIAHRDIKPENIVISTEGVAKLCDFGWAAVVQNTRQTYCGTLDYACPQVLQRKSYDISVDIWSIGILTYEMLMGKAPFEDKDRTIVRERIVNSESFELVYSESVPQEAREFIEWLIQKDPAKRPKITELLSHRMFAAYSAKPAKKAF